MRPGGRSDPETMAAIVSRMWCFVSRSTLSGSARLRAPAKYELSFSMTELTAGLTSWAAAIAIRGNAAAAEIHAACCNQFRRVRHGGQVSRPLSARRSFLSTHHFWRIWLEDHLQRELNLARAGGRLGE